MNLRQFRQGVALCAGFILMTTAGAQTTASTPAAKSAKAPAKKAASPAYKPVIEAKAMGLLKEMSEKIAAAKSASFTATVGYEFPSKLGPPIAYTMRYDVAMQRPDKLKIVMPGDGPASEFYYNGKTIMAYAPAENLVAITDAPPTIDGALATAYKAAAIYFPFTDLLVADPYKALTEGTVLAFYIGSSSVIGSVKTEMLAWANKDVFLQVWIGAEDKLPRRVRAVFAADRWQFRHEMELSNWKLDLAHPAETFTSQKALAAPRIGLKSPTVPAPTGIKPLVKMPAANAPATKPQPKSP